MKILRSSFLALFVAAGIIAYVPAVGTAQTALIVQIFPREIRQGQTSLLRVTTPPDVIRVEMVFEGRPMPLYRSAQNDWVGFLAVDMSAQRGTKPVDIYTWTESQSTAVPETHYLEVVWGAFKYQNIILPSALVPLLDPNINRQEYNILARAYARNTPVKLWVGEFMRPVPGETISEFGGIRTYNDGVLEGRHTGIDFRVGLGDPISATGTGRVVYARHLPIHGNHIIIDHGWGVLTGYSHMQEMYVVPGQRVLAGDVIGAVGSTGRTQGAHLHLEIAVNGLWVDPLQFMSLPVPAAASELTSRE